MSELNNIDFVIKSGLCTQCGICSAVCPNDAIIITRDKRLNYVPKIDPWKCNNCSICVKVCPGHEIDYESLNKQLFGKQPSNPYVGNYLNIYIGSSAMKDVYERSSSGGIATSLLLYALNHQVIDGAIVVKDVMNNPFNPEIFVANSEKSLLEALQSKYFPIPMNSKLRSVNKDGKYAIVGLPCHIEGLRKAQKLEYFSSNILFGLGIFCGYCPSIEATRYLLYQYDINEDQISNIKYRFGDWPGKFVVQLKNCEYRYPKSSLGFSDLHLLFIPPRCLLCINETNELADISVGDAWDVNNSDLKSVILARTNFGKELLEQGYRNKYINLKEVGFDDLYKSQAAMLKYKKVGFLARKNLRKVINKKTPTFTIRLPNSNFKQYLAGLFLYISIAIIKFKPIKRLLKFSYGHKLIREHRYYLSKLLSS